MSNWMKRMLSFLLAAVMLLGCGTVVSAEEATGAAVNTVTGKVYDDLAVALREAGAEETVRLTADTQTYAVLVPEDVVLDLAGHTVRADYAVAFGDLVDRSEGSEGLLAVQRDRVMLRKDNDQLSVWAGEGYRFFDITKFNTAWQPEKSRFAFQVFIDRDAHELLTADLDEAGITVNVRITWKQNEGTRSQFFAYNSGLVTEVLKSYYLEGTEEKYGRMFTLILSGAEGLEELAFEVVVASETGVEFGSGSVSDGNEDEDGEEETPDDNILIHNEEFVYGSYFDHDRFEGNTGTRLTSGDYAKIRSADALLPAQDITIKVTDTNLTDYKVTLGYYTADGIYTGRTGILPMQNGELTITAAEMRGGYFRVNVYIYNGRFTKVPESAEILVYGGTEIQPEDPTEPTTPPTDPTDPTEPEEDEKPWAGKKITILGDSISTGGYPGILKDLTGAQIQNLSVSGTKLTGGLTGRVADVAEDADLVIVFGGTNDYWHKNVSIGSADSSNTFVGALHYIHDYLKTERQQAQVLFVFPPDQTFGGNPSTTDFGYGTLDDFRAAFLEFCTANAVPYLDLGETEFDSAKHSGDGVHPNSAGHQIVAQAIFDRLEAGLETSIIATRQVRLLPQVTQDLPERALAAAPGVQFDNSPYAYTNTGLFAGKHITRIGIPVKSVQALDGEQTFTLSVVKTVPGAYQYVSKNVLKLPLEQLGDSTTVNKWIYVDVDLQLADDETLAFGMPDDTVTWGYSKTNISGYNFRSASGSWTSPISESILFDVYVTQTLEFKPTEDGLVSVTEERIFPNVLNDFPESAIPGGNPVEFTYPPYSYVNQDLFAGKRITKIGIPVQSVKALDENQIFTLSVIKTGSGSYQYVSQHELKLPLEELGESTAVNKWIYLDVDLQLASDETLAYGGKEDTVTWAWKRNFANDTYKFRDATGGTTRGIFFDIRTETVLSYEDFLKEQEEEQFREKFSGKVISILGDSISTFSGYIPVADGFNLEHRARYPQSNLLTNVQDTWWMQTITELDAKLGINDSWAGSRVANNITGNSGDYGEDAAMASMTRILNLGANGTPDVILFYGGTNDIAHSLPLGSFSPDTAPTAVDLTSTIWNSAADAYVAAIMRLQYVYPDAQLIAMLPTYSVGYYSNEKLAQFNAVFGAICDHYSVRYIDLRECGITTADLPDGIHPDANGMDFITNAVLDQLRDVQMKKGENVVHSVTHVLTGAKSSRSYYKGVTHGNSYSTTITGDDLRVTVTMDGVDITADCYQQGEVVIGAVTGDLVVTATARIKLIFEEYLKTLPDDLCSGVNIWKILGHDEVYYTSTGWDHHTRDEVRSVTFDIREGDRLWANAFGTGDGNGSIVGNGSQVNGIRVTFFFADGTLRSMAPGEVYAEFSQYGCLTAPKGTVAVNVPMWTDNEECALYILNRDHAYENGTCSGCGDMDPLAALNGKSISILGDSISTFQGWSNNTSYNTTIGSNAVYYNGSRDGFASVSETWWMQTITETGLELVVNNSWSGDRVVERGISRAKQLHDNEGQEPDIIAVYLGINDFRTNITVDTFRVKYDEMISGLLQTYDAADVYLFTLLYTTNVNSGVVPADVVYFNEIIAETAERYGCSLVDLYNDTGITPENLASYMGDQVLHPNYAGMDLITDCFLATLKANYVPDPA